MWKVSNRALLLLSLPILLLFFSTMRCSFDEPSAPSWDVDVTVPLISKIYTMTEIAEDESSLSLDSTNNMLNFEVDAELDNYYVGDQLTLETMQENFSLELGTFNIDAPAPEFTNLELREVFPEADDFDGQTVVVPPFHFETDLKDLDPYAEFEYVVISSGMINIRVENGFSVPMGPPITLEIWDTAEQTRILSTTRQVQVNPGETQFFDFTLDGKRMPNALSVRFVGDSPGSDTPVEVDADSKLEIESTIGDLQVEEALAEIPSQTVTGDESVSINESLAIEEASIEQGQILLTIEGQLPVDAWIRYSLPDLETAAGVALVDSFFLAKNTNSNIPIDLDGYQLRPQAAAIGNQTIRFSWTARTIDTGTEQVLVTSSDFLDADIQLSEMRFSEVTGKIGEKEIDISQSEIEFDIPVDLDSVFFETATMELLLNNAINFPASIDLMIEGQNDAGAVSQLTVNEPIQQAETPGVPTQSVIVLNQQNSNINDFISILPTLINVDGKARLGDENWVGTVTQDDFINGMVKITAPFALSLPPQDIKSEVDELEIDDDVREDIDENLSSGTIYVELLNHLPMGASIEFMFAQDSTTLFQNPILSVGEVRVEGGTLDNSGFVSQPQNSESTIELTEEETRVFLRKPLFAGLLVKVDGTNGEFIKVRGSDYIRVKSFSNIKMKINQD